MRNLIVAALVVAFSSSVSMAQQLPSNIAESKTIKIALFPAFPPLAYRDPDTNKLIGLDVELAEAVAKNLGLKIDWREVSYDAAVPALSTRRVDMALSMVNQPESRDVLDYVDYIRSGAQFYTRADMADQIKEPADVCGKTVGGSRRTNYPGDAQRWSDEFCAGAGRPGVKIIGTEGSADARTQLKQRRIDVVVQSSESVPYTMSLEPGSYTLVGKPFARSFISIAFTKKQEALRDVVAHEISKLYQDGTYAAILEKYKLQANSIEAVSVNGQPVK